MTVLEGNIRELSIKINAFRTVGRFIALILLVVAALVAGGFLFADRLFHPETYKAQILAAVQESLGRKVLFDQGDFYFHFGPAFAFTKVVVKEKDGLTDFVTADRVTFTLAVLPLLQKKLEVKDLLLEKGTISLSRDQSGTFNISDLLQGKSGGQALQVRGVRLKKGGVRFVDRMVAPGGVTTLLTDVDLSLDHLGRGKATEVRLSTSIVDGAQPGAVTISGVVTMADEGKPLGESLLNLKVLARKVDAARYWPYYERHVPFRQILGHLDLDTTFKGKFAAFTSKGTAKINGLRFDYPQVFHAVLAPQHVAFKYDLERTLRDVLVKSIDLTVDNLTVKGSCAVRGIDTSDPRITAEATTSRFRLEEFGAYIPYGIIVKDVARYIEEHIKGGTYKLDKGRLDGRVSQIAHMERGTNYDVLFISGRVENGVVSYGPSVPAFNSIRGELEMRGKDFSLHRMAGKFGTSPFTFEGKIADYPLDTPSSYPFTMNIKPQQQEVSWLFGWSKGFRPAVTPGSQLQLRGEGFTSGYSFSGDWDLNSAGYSVEALSKPAGRANGISFRGTIDRQEARFSSLQFNLAPLTVAASGSYRFGRNERVNLEVKSNQFPLDDVAPMFTLAKKYQAGGKLQATVHGEGSGTNPGDFRWNGAVALNGFHFKPGERIKTVGNATGTITFTGNSIETSLLSAEIGTSTVSGRGSLVNFKKPALNLVFSSPSLDPSDFGFRSAGRGIKATGVQGEISLEENNLQIKSLTGQINNSNLAIKGNVTDLDNPDADLIVTSTHLELEDILLLKTIETHQGGGREPRVTLKAEVAADTAKWGNLEVKKFATGIIYEGKILYLQPLECLLLGGRLTGKGRVDLSSPTPRYQGSFKLAKVAADQLVRQLGMKRQELTGLLSLQGELTAKGNDPAELKKSALGSVKLRCEEGTLRRFPVLSKVFSILNVSQLLKFKLPDMVSGGMPYSQIAGSFSVRDGVIATSDLFVASNALNISTVGKIDLARNQIEATIGVQPLQAIDKVVSTIPIVGWILTGKNKSLITAYFEAKGSLDDPKVSAIPVKAMARGVFDIFKRLFELPAKLITDTGEVIIGR